MATRNLLIELFVEELPPKALQKLGEAFAAALAAGLTAEGLLGPGSEARPFASPRRLAAHVSCVLERAPDKSVSQKLMPVSVGLTPSGEATPALLKRLAALGADANAVPGLERRLDGKAEALFHTSDVQGATLAQALQNVLTDAIAGLPIPKVMQYQLADGWTSVDFVRPAHGLVALHGGSVVPVRALGLDARRETHGHRFEAAIDPVVLRDADSYERQLQSEGAVIASFAARRAEIAAQLQRAATREGLLPVDDDALLDEVTALVERPNVLTCRFEADFLDVPPEVLILTMKANQKYFPLLDTQRKLTNRFLVVSNIRPENPARVIEGNERVVRPRLADAKFFYDQDRKKPLAARVAGLDKVVYHGKLGTQGERTHRVRAIARSIGDRLGGASLCASADRAALLAKADLLTDMVGEFPELQGTMGRYYARHDGEPDEVATAIEDHYRPRFAGDVLPSTPTGVVVALADKLETLTGLFGIGQVPSGDKDPFALRRQALGVIRMLIEKSLPLDLDALLGLAVSAFASRHAESDEVPAPVVRPTLLPDTAARVGAFIYERLAGTLREQGYAAQEVDAVLALRPARLADIAVRLAAVRAFSALPEAASLAAANKRVGNILRKAEGPVEAAVEAALLREPAEAALHAALAVAAPAADAAFQRGDYAASLQAWAALKAPVDTFFDSVMVNAEDPVLRANRLGLLARLHGAMNRVADLSKLAA